MLSRLQFLLYSKNIELIVYNTLSNKTGNVTYNVTLRRVRLFIVAVQKQ